MGCKSENLVVEASQNYSEFDTGMKQDPGVNVTQESQVVRESLVLLSLTGRK